MRKRIALALLCTFAVAGCAAQSQPAPSGRASAPAPAARAAAAAGNPLGQISNGMTKAQVREVAGSPSDERSYASGKAWIPFYFGNDVRRTTWHYKGQGRVTFADGNQFGGGGSEVISVEIDQSEPGSN